MAEPRKVLSGSARAVVPGARIVGRTDSETAVHVTVVLARKTDVLPQTLEQHTMVRPQERPHVDHAAFEDTFGASDAAVDAVTALAARYGLAVVSVDKLRRVVELAGAAARMEAAFGTQLHEYAVGVETYRGRQGPLLLPAEMALHIEAVLGLDNRPVAKPRFRPRASAVSYYPNELAALYNFPALDGTGQTIALIELGGNYGPDDLAAYFAAAGLARHPVVRTVAAGPNVPVAYGTDTLSDGEVMLDIEVVGAMAPGATIVVYFAENTDQGFYQATSQAVHDPATTAVSISWGAAEKSWSQQTMDAWDSLGQSAILLNVPIFVAAGDHGCADETPNDQGFDRQRHADFPSTCAHGVISCGGTRVIGRGRVITSETVWNENDGWATGGGVSMHFPAPPWQAGLSAEAGGPMPMRGVPDVAGNADSSTGIKVRVNGADGVSGGTSAVAPQWAALTALLSQSLGRRPGFFLPLLYANPGVTNDITAGNNGVFGIPGFAAKAGWDACTGLGSPDGGRLLALLSGAPVAAPNPVLVVGDPVPVLSGGDGAPIPALPTNPPFDAAAAVLQGEFIQAAYAMAAAAGSSITPPPSPDFPAGYALSAWVQMKDFILLETDPQFYGFIAQSTAHPGRFVLALRGTLNGVEWWDDANSIIKVPFKIPGCGSIGLGFARIYNTLEVVEKPKDPAAAPAPRSLRSVGGFAQQVASLVARHAAAGLRAADAAAAPTLAVTGHSLGAALATLYAFDNAKTEQVHNPGLWTFASPRVGDADFAAAFNGLGLTSWRIANAPDIVPGLPPQFLGFEHVDTLQAVDSRGKVKASVGCWHALATYLSLLDPARSPGPDCRLQAAPAALTIPQAVASGPTTLSIQVGAVTVTVTVPSA